MWNKTFDLASPDFKYTDTVVVATSDGYEDCDAIDPGVMLDPVTGRLCSPTVLILDSVASWNLIQKQVKRIKDNKTRGCGPLCEATDLIYREVGITCLPRMAPVVMVPILPIIL